MLEFPREYFIDEVRDGFYVNGLMKRCWAAQLEALNDIAVVCEKYQIRWYADFGTLLGAVRHGGFVPWDDDIDICMFREDYIKFLSVAEDELRKIWKGYCVHNYHNGNYWEVLSHVADKERISFDAERAKKFHDYPFEVGVDIFPLDYLCRDSEEEEMRATICQTIFSIADNCDLDDNPNEKTLETLGFIERSTGRDFDKNRSLRMQLYEIGEAMFSLYSREDADDVTLMAYWLRELKYKNPISAYSKTIPMRFEVMDIPVPEGYDIILRGEYGDYRKIVRNGGAHNYPAYEEHLQKVEAELGTRSPFRKRVSADDLKGAARRRDIENPRKQIKQQLQELVKLLDDTHREIIVILEEGRIEETRDILVQCQDSAIQIGNYIEENYGADFVTVHYLEEYCEEIYQLHENLINSEAGKLQEISKMLQEAIKPVMRSIENDIYIKKEIVFLPFKPKYWSSMESAYEEAKNDPTADVIVMPIPYYEKSIGGVLCKECYEADEFPDKLSVIDYNTYQFQVRWPDEVVIQVPFDDDNYVMSVHPEFFARRIRRFTGHLKYIPYFNVEEIVSEDARSYKAMDQYVISPGVVYADEVVVQSENMKAMYVKKLIEYFGEDTEELWNGKIIVPDGSRRM
ncbi:MAG: LicD family protein [Lachnospiraceae bacterium]|nr:LicD family protein [Lachnospiraceae bacterium]